MTNVITAKIVYKKRPKVPWDYRKYNIDNDNALLKGQLEVISENYGY